MTPRMYGRYPAMLAKAPAPPTASRFSGFSMDAVALASRTMGSAATSAPAGNALTRMSAVNAIPSHALFMCGVSARLLKYPEQRRSHWPRAPVDLTIRGA